MVWQAGLGAVLRVKFRFGTASRGTVGRGRQGWVRHVLVGLRELRSGRVRHGRRGE